jgi:hypothetical protein
MKTLIADDATLAILRQANSLVEIRDSSGTIIGFFAPVGVERANLYAEAAARADPSEIQKRKETPGKTHTTAEVLEHLKALETP